jgi:single-stranded-DNA-specific exonuclease
LAGIEKEISRLKNHWQIARTPEQAGNLLKETRLHPAILSILLSRGIKSADQIRSFLSPRLEDLQPPDSLPGMQKAVQRIRSAVAGKQKILLYGDYDADGVSSAAILYRTLRESQADCEVYIPNRFTDGYGVNLKSVERLAKKKYGLWICLDNGINARAEVDYLNGKSVDTIIVDHHLPLSQDLPSAFCILNPKLEKQAPGAESLAACGIVFKLVWALAESLERVKIYLDLVALGTIADVAPVSGDNRILLKFGLEALRRTKHPGLMALMQQSKIQPAFLSSKDVAFSLAPKINAGGRMGSPEEAFKLLVTENSTEASNLARILEQGNQERQKVEQAAYAEAVEQIEADPVHTHQRILVVEHPDWHQGVLGIVASRLVDRYQKSAIVIRLNQGEGKGSGRSTQSISLFDCLKACEGLLVSYGGHARAAGLLIRQADLAAFKKKINEAAAQLSAPAPDPELVIDAEISLSELGPAFLEQLSALEPFGPENPKPLFISRDVRLKGKLNKRGQDTLQAWVSDREGRAICEIVGFRRFSRWRHLEAQPAFSIVYQPTMRYFNGITSIQLELEDWD